MATCDRSLFINSKVNTQLYGEYTIFVRPLRLLDPTKVAMTHQGNPDL